jgi:hypothetical protein
MPVGKIIQLQDLEDAKAAFIRVQFEIEAQDPNNLTPYNVDILSATSTAIGVAPQLSEYRDRAAKLPDFDIRCFDGLVDFAKAAWYLHVTNLPPVEPPDAAQVQQEMTALRAKLLMWAQPLAASGKFSQAAVDAIRQGSGMKDAASDLVSLVTLYRSVWDQVRTMCGVTEQDLLRAAVIGPAVFSMVSRSENAPGPSLTDVALKVRQAWSLLDRAYQQCRRAVTWFRFLEGDADTIAPSLRRNAGRRAAADKPDTTAAADPAANASGGAVVGGSSSPFIGE